MYVRLGAFRSLNDDFGRDAGDKVLTDVGQLLLAEFRHSDVVARAGAGEFFVLLTGTGTEGLEKPGNNLAKAIREENMNLPFELIYDMGAIEYDPDRHSGIDSLMAEADEAMQADASADDA